MSFASIHIPEFPVAAWLYNQPELLTGALVVLGGTPPLEQVASLNAIATAAGVQRGMSKVQAETACKAQYRPRCENEERAAFQAVLQTAERFSPRVQAIASPANTYAGKDCMAATVLIDRTGTGALFGTAQLYAERLQQELALQGFAASIATAPNAEASLLLARSGHSVVCVEQPRLQEALSTLPVALLPCEASQHAVLHRWGIRTLGQLAQLPLGGLISRLGQAGHRLQQLALGIAPHLLTPTPQAFTLTASLELELPLSDLERLLVALAHLLDELLAKAVEHAYAIRNLTATLTLDHALTHRIHVAPATPSQNSTALLRLLGLELEAHPPRSEVFALTLQAEPAQPQQAQCGLFQSQFPSPGKTDLLLARLRSIAGQQNVGSPQLANSHREDAFIMAPFFPASQDAAPPSAAAMRHVLRAVRPPQNVRLWMVNEQPGYLYWRGTRLRITDVAGPWHSSGNWWDATSFECDFWDVSTADPPLVLRLQQDSAAKTWNVVGLYD